MKTKKITKKQEKEFNDKVKRVVLSAGFTLADWYDYQKETRFGIVRLSIPTQAGSEIYTVFSRFDDIEKAKKIFNCGYTGKYNFHCNDAQETLGMVEFFLHQLEEFGKDWM